MPLGQTGDSVNWVGAVFAAHGAELVDKDGNITVKSDATQQMLEWFKKLVPLLPADVFAWDDSRNNKWLISGKGALIMNPPSAWAVAVRDAPKVAEQCWTLPVAEGTERAGSTRATLFLGDLGLLGQQVGRKEPAAALLAASSVEQLVAAQQGLRHPGV